MFLFLCVHVRIMYVCISVQINISTSSPVEWPVQRLLDYLLSQMHGCTPASPIFCIDSSLVLWSPFKVWSSLPSRWYLKQPKMQVEMILEPNGMEKHLLEISKKGTSSDYLVLISWKICGMVILWVWQKKKKKSLQIPGVFSVTSKLKWLVPLGINI